MMKLTGTGVGLTTPGVGASVLFVPAFTAGSIERSMTEENFIWCFRGH